MNLVLGMADSLFGIVDLVFKMVTLVFGMVNLVFGMINLVFRMSLAWLIIACQSVLQTEVSLSQILQSRFQSSIHRSEGGWEN